MHAQTVTHASLCARCSTISRQRARTSRRDSRKLTHSAPDQLQCSIGGWTPVASSGAAFVTQVRQLKLGRRAVSPRAWPTPRTRECAHGL
ncbi:hypothetical protein ACFPRL_07565 [Pseudoclavibacter helvolus]